MTYAIRFLFLSAALLFVGSASAQLARVQLIHNAADVSLDTVDVYVNDQLINDVAFRTATGIIRLSAGTYRVSLNHKSSIDSGDQALAKFDVSLAANSGNVIMVAGVADTTQYATNPEGRSRSVRLIHRRNVLFSSSNPNNVSTTIIHGSTDAPGVNINTRPTSTTLALTNVRYGDTTNNLFIPAQQTFVDVRINSGGALFNSYLLPLAGRGGRSVVVFASGFVTPSANQNGQEFDLFVVDTNGGVAVKVNEACKVQLVHASADTSFGNVDIWMNGVKVFANLPRTRATATVGLAAGSYNILVTKALDPIDTVYAVNGVVFDATKNYVGFVSGVKDTTLYASNPNGINTTINFYGTDAYTETGIAGNVRLWYFNGVANSDSTQLSRGTTAPVNLFSKSVFGQISGPQDIATTATTAYVLREEIAGQLNRTFRLRLPTSFGGRVGVLYSVGYLKSSSNPDSVLNSSYYIAFTDGSVVSVDELNAFVQIIHASADPTAAEVDIYLNGALALDNFKFPSATPFLPIVPYKPAVVKIAPANSTSEADAFFTSTITADSSKYHYAIANGVRTPANFAVNPDGISTAFNVVVNNQAQITAAVSNKNIDLMYFHSMTDAPMTSCKGAQQTQFLSKDDKYKESHGYRAHAAFDELQFDLLNAADNSLIFSGMINLISHQGKTGLVFATGFLSSANNQNGPSPAMYVAWPEGGIDTFTNLNVGLKKNQLQDFTFAMYPNPAAEFMLIDMDVPANGTAAITFTDITGKVVMTQTKLMNKGLQQMEVNTSNLQTGIYFVTVNTANGTSTQRIVISR